MCECHGCVDGWIRRLTVATVAAWPRVHALSRLVISHLLLATADRPDQPRPLEFERR